MAPRPTPAQEPTRLPQEGSSPTHSRHNRGLLVAPLAAPRPKDIRGLDTTLGDILQQPHSLPILPHTMEVPHREDPHRVGPHSPPSQPTNTMEVPLDPTATRATQEPPQEALHRPSPSLEPPTQPQKVVLQVLGGLKEPSLAPTLPGSKITTRS